MANQPAIWASLRALRVLLNAMPHSSALRLGSALGGVVEKFSAARVEKIRRRCALVLGVTPDEARRIVSGSYAHFGRAAAEFIRLPKMAPLMDKIVEFRGEEHLKEAMKLGRGAIFLSGHIGNWEYGAALIAKLGYPISAIGAEQRDPRIMDAMVEIRSAGGVKHVGKGLDIKAAVSCLKRGEILAVLFDQDARDRGIISPFLGYPASTPTGPIRMAQKLGCPVLPVRVTRSPDGERFIMTMDAPFEGKDGRPFGDDLRHAADTCNSAISSWIRENPEQWLWMYPRWESTMREDFNKCISAA
ncbi:lipid A biosynthesis acyltransferase [Synergistales bacterium]|nr:lipid A biosynthesis acyltransferase [Synergistales bacterium]